MGGGVVGAGVVGVTSGERAVGVDGDALLSQRVQDLLGDWWRRGEVGALRPETPFVGGVLDGVGLTVVALVGEAALSLGALVLAWSAFAGFLGFDSVTSLVTVRVRAVTLVGVVLERHDGDHRAGRA